MSTPIYQLFIGKNNVLTSLVGKNFTQTQTEEMIQKEKASREAVQAEVLLACDSAWADEEHPWWGVLRFPSLEARIQHTRTLAEIGWLDWVEAFTLLGTSESEPALIKFPNPIYKLWLIHGNPAAAQWQNSQPKGIRAAVWDKHNAAYADTGSIVVLQCNSYWCNEAYPYFGVSAYPNIEANMKVMQVLDELGWPGFMDCFTLLGIPQQLD